MKSGFLGVALLLAGCGSSTFIDEVAFLKRHTEVLVLQAHKTGSAMIAVCPEYQGRVMTSTATGPGGLSFGWINHDLVASGEPRKHITPYGGEDRFWMGPEGGQYSIFFGPGDPQDLEHWQTPAGFDSEPFDVARTSMDFAILKKRLNLVNAAGTEFKVDLIREIRALDPNDPGKILGIRPAMAVTWVGFQSRNKVTNAGDKEWKKETGLLSTWILGMYAPSPSTTVVIPYKPGADELLGPIVNDAYFGKVPADRLKIEPGMIYFRGDGLRRSKIGVSPKRAMGVLGSWDPESGVLTIVHFHQTRNVFDYVNSMWEVQKQPFAGDVANSYNDGPAAPGAAPLGPFYELESSSPGLALKPGLSYTHVHSTFHFQGPTSDLDAIARHALGVGLAQIEAALPH